MNLVDNAAFRIGQWRVNPALDEISRDGTTVKLAPRTMRVLVCLAEHAGQVVTVNQLLDAVWKDLVVTQYSVYQAVATLRRALGDDTRNPTCIAHVPRRGYRLVAPVEPDTKAQDPVTLPAAVAAGADSEKQQAPVTGKPEHTAPAAPEAGQGVEHRLGVIDHTPDRTAHVPDAFHHVQWTRLPEDATTPAFVERIQRLLSGATASAPDPARSASSVVASAPPAPRALLRRRSGLLYGAIAAAAVLALGYFAVERLRGSGSRAQGATSIAVLPLTNESGEASQQYFSDGISEDLITALSQFPGLKVIGRTSAFQFRDTKEDSRSIGAKLGVAHLLEGSVRRSGEVVRVSAELIDTADGSTQWTERYDRHYKDLFTLQDEITHAVAGALRTKLLPGEHAAAQTERPPGGSLEAYGALLQGRFYLFRNTETDDRKAVEFYTQATQIDPHYALAWSGLAQAWSYLGYEFLEGAEMQEAFAKAREAANRALALSPDLAAAHLARGDLLQVADFDWRGAEAEFRRAVELAPNDGEAKLFLGGQLAVFGDLESAVELTRQALATEPLQAYWYNWLAGYLSGLHRLDEAEPAVRRAIELQPAAAVYHDMLAIIQIQRGNARAALAAAQQEPPGVWRDIALALALQIGGDRSAADAALRTLIDKHANGFAYPIADVYALRNDAKETFEWLDRALSHRDPGITNLLYDPIILRYKDDPRFAAFCRKVGLPVPGEAPAHKSP